MSPKRLQALLLCGLVGGCVALPSVAAAAPGSAHDHDHDHDHGAEEPCPEAEPEVRRDDALHGKITRCRSDLAAPGDDSIAPCPDARPAQLEWNPDWPRFGVAEAVVTGSAMAGALGALAISEVEDRWSRPQPFDTWMRDRLRLGSPGARQRARDASDVLLTLEINLLVVDALAVAWWAHGSGDVALQMVLIDAEAIALNTMINTVVAAIASRERPYAERCGLPNDAGVDDCTGRRRYRSFFSGHTSTSFVAAGLTCMHHAHLPLYGGGAGDVLVCSSSFLAAAAVGALRVVSDQHYVSDVMTGAGIGTLIGLGVPWLLHYRGGELELEAASEANGAAKSSLTFGVVPGPTGATLWGAF
ncbi:MAG: phosphatase PAP2 family protein [Deltaproteobacteria bacterium]|jgi:membrane-associated phospholipid phosphatase|nr:phosphatase PAP2 family protein [Deltaproteobacteria bacterium]MBW2530133.1 phosphatase PAP2 family protein [Deltaproteobacteria bacterium]